MAGDSDADDMRPLKLDCGEVECVTEFKYLGSIVEAKGGIAQEVGERIAKASKAFGALREPIFRDSKLSEHSYKLSTTKKFAYASIECCTGSMQATSFFLLS